MAVSKLWTMLAGRSVPRRWRGPSALVAIASVMICGPGCGTDSALPDGGASGGVAAASPVSGVSEGAAEGRGESPATSGGATEQMGNAVVNATGDGVGATPGSISGGAPDDTVAPTGLLCELLNHPEDTTIADATPEFSWVVPSQTPNERQVAFRILVASNEENLAADAGDLWDSGKTSSSDSINVPYAGLPLAAAGSYFWKVQTWNSADRGSMWSAPQNFVMASEVGPYTTPKQPVVLERIAPTSVTMVGSGHYFIDFGRAAFGWVELTLDAAIAGGSVQVSLGERASAQAVDTTLDQSSIRSAAGSITLQQGQHTYRLATPPDTRNTSGAAILLPEALGVVLPFRYVEVTNSPVSLSVDMLRQVAVHYPVDATASSFSSSDDALNQVLALSRYSIIAPTFAGVYIDGDRERIPYEGDAYIQQLGHYAVDRDFALARHSHEYLLVNPTWPTEWKQHSVMMAWADWMYTGNVESLSQFYDVLASQKTLESHVDADGLLDSTGLQDLVDWPASERDGFVFSNRNAVVNAFWYLNLQQMADIAAALGKTSDATRYGDMAARAFTAFNSLFFDLNTGLYVDAVGSTHSSLHANMFPLAFDLVPADRKASVVSFVKSRGMACSVYGSQYLLEGLYKAGDADAALSLMTATTDRSWMNMLRVGSTMTLEAWDARYKPNLDWNHAWGAVPANIVPRFLIGVQPLEPGFGKIRIQPQMGRLTHAEALVPTIRGGVRVVLDHPEGQAFSMQFTLPSNMTANVALPSLASPCDPLLDGVVPSLAAREGTLWIDGIGSGAHELRCQ